MNKSGSPPFRSGCNRTSTSDAAPRSAEQGQVRGRIRHKRPAPHLTVGPLHLFRSSLDLPLLCAQKSGRILRLVPFRSYLAKRNATQKSCLGSIGLG